MTEYSWVRRGPNTPTLEMDSYWQDISYHPSWPHLKWEFKKLLLDAESFYILFPAALGLLNCCGSKWGLWCPLQYDSLTNLVRPMICLLNYLYLLYLFIPCIHLKFSSYAKENPFRFVIELEEGLTLGWDGYDDWLDCVPPMCHFFIFFGKWEGLCLQE